MALHFVGFRGDEYVRACRMFGNPDLIHYDWDVRALQEFAPGDVMVFARGSMADTPRSPSFNDSERYKWHFGSILPQDRPQAPSTGTG